ncbi:MAG: RnfH family protein [Gammaproteobacteria bacterium]|nr:RnfH family protein [Gammaproteobacteria bacterium]
MIELKTIAVEIIYALPHEQRLIRMLVAPGTTAREVLICSGIPEEYPQVDVETAKLGIFGQALGTKGLDAAAKYIMQPGDRLEVYRPLIADPKEARKQRAQKAMLAARQKTQGP